MKKTTNLSGKRSIGKNGIFILMLNRGNKIAIRQEIKTPAENNWKQQKKKKQNEMKINY